MKRREYCVQTADRVYRLERRVLDLEQREIDRRCREYANPRSQKDLSWDEVAAFLIGGAVDDDEEGALPVLASILARHGGHLPWCPAGSGDRCACESLCADARAAAREDM